MPRYAQHRAAAHMPILARIERNRCDRARYDRQIRHHADVPAIRRRIPRAQAVIGGETELWFPIGNPVSHRLGRRSPE